MGLRELKRERTRRLISAKAFELFVDHGFARTTVEQIAAAAEVGPSTLYRYFPTKETLVLEFVEESMFGALTWLRDQPGHTDPRTALEQVIDRVLDRIESDPARVRAVYDLAAQTPSLGAHLSDVIWRWRHELTTELIRRLPTDDLDGGGSRRAALGAALAAGITMNVIETVVRAWVDDPDGPDVKTLAREALRLLTDGGVQLPAGGWHNAGHDA